MLGNLLGRLHARWFNSGSIDHTASSIPACRSPSAAKRAGIVAIVKSSIATSGSSSHVTGADTGPVGLPLTEYAAAIVRSFAFWSH